MVHAPVSQAMTFEAFLEWYPDDGRRYELIEGCVIEMLPTGPHEDVGGFLAAELNFAIRTHQLPYSIPRTCLIKPQAEGAGYFPNVAVLDRERLSDEPLWATASVIQKGSTIPLVIEVVSTNWRDDYGHKFVEYEAMGIVEYWMVDFRALGAVRHIGKPKQPTITVCQIKDGEYQMRRFVAGERIISGVFSQLNLTTDAVFAAAG
ncbi:MAG: Uma2 family endonuclease [Cyanobacteria bacterium P01_F01_bin.150]